MLNTLHLPTFLQLGVVIWLSVGLIGVISGQFLKEPLFLWSRIVMNMQPSCDQGGKNTAWVTAEKQNGKDLVPRTKLYGAEPCAQLERPHWSAMCEINKLLIFYIPVVILLEQFSFTLANIGLFLLLVGLYLKSRSWYMLLCATCDEHSVLKWILAG